MGNHTFTIFVRNIQSKSFILASLSLMFILKARYYINEIYYFVSGFVAPDKVYNYASFILQNFCFVLSTFHWTVQSFFPEEQKVIAIWAHQKPLTIEYRSEYLLQKFPSKSKVFYNLRLEKRLHVIKFCCRLRSAFDSWFSYNFRCFNVVPCWWDNWKRNMLIHKSK